jgi:hypothetical protein
MAPGTDANIRANVVFNAQPTEPSIGQVQCDFLAQLSFRAYAVAVTDNHHSDHQLRIDRRTAEVTVVRREMFTQSAEIQHRIDAAQQMIFRDVVCETKVVEELILTIVLASHHAKGFPLARRSLLRHHTRSFSTESTHRGRDRYISQSTLSGAVCVLRLQPIQRHGENDRASILAQFPCSSDPVVRGHILWAGLSR